MFTAANRVVVPWRTWSWVRCSAWLGYIGNVFRVRSRAWIWDFSSTHNTIALSGGTRYGPTASVTSATSSGSVENVNVSAFHGRTPYSLQTAATVAWSAPSRGASRRLDQCVTPRLAGGGSNVAARIAARSTYRGRPGRGRSANPANTLSPQRDRHRFTVERETPTVSAMTWSPTPPAANKTIRAPCAIAAAVVPERTNRSNPARSPALNVNAGAVSFTMPLRGTNRKHTSPTRH